MTEPPCHTASAMPGLVQHITTSLDVGGAQAMLVKLLEANITKRKCARPAVLSLMRPGTFGHRCPRLTGRCNKTGFECSRITTTENSGKARP